MNETTTDNRMIIHRNKFFAPRLNRANICIRLSRALSTILIRSIKSSGPSSTGVYETHNRYTKLIKIPFTCVQCIFSKKLLKIKEKITSHAYLRASILTPNDNLSILPRASLCTNWHPRNLRRFISFYPLD